jgi:photosystem II stability/assembly factor-like uncharacterized protein
MIRHIILILFLPSYLYSQTITIDLIPPESDASFRGLSVIDDSVAWVSGSKGIVGKTTDAGKHWKYSTVPGFDKFDFRSIYAFDANKAIIANAGAPANILLTTDGGKSWSTVYSNTDTAAFIDGVDFWNDKEGVIYGDPIKGKMLLLKTIDGGLKWRESPDSERPTLEPGEASFAASGTNIRCFEKSEVIIATGGKISRLWYSNNKGISWKTISAPIIQGEPAMGIFSFARRKPGHLVIVGGNYLQDSLKTDHVFYSEDQGRSWSPPLDPTRGYRESVEYIHETILIAAGPSGVDVSYNGGMNWQPLSDEKYFHVVRLARNGSLIVIAGGKGKVGILRD